MIVYSWLDIPIHLINKPKNFVLISKFINKFFKKNSLTLCFICVAYYIIREDQAYHTLVSTIDTI